MHRSIRACLTGILLGLAATGIAGSQQQPGADFPVADIPAALASAEDVWGNAALAHPNGPTYEFFENLLPPLRYVNAGFRYYPIVMSAPNSPVKGRWASDGSGVNLRSGLDTWRDSGIPVRFLVGDEADPFGSSNQRPVDPACEEQWLPVYSTTCDVAGEGHLVQECFAATNSFAQNGAICIRFQLQGTGRQSLSPVSVHAQLEPDAWRLDKGSLRAGPETTWVRFDGSWQWDAASNRATARVRPDQPVHLVVFTQAQTQSFAPLTAGEFDRLRSDCRETWTGILKDAARITIPEPVVQNAWRSLIAGNRVLANGDQMNYSAGNLYERMYCEESAAAVHAMDLFGLQRDARELMEGVLRYPADDPLKFHNAAFQLQLIQKHWRLTGEKFLEEPLLFRGNQLARAIVLNRDAGHGLLPREPYCGDIQRQVHSLNSNANAWRALRDWASCLDEIGHHELAREYVEAGKAFRQAIIEAVAASERTDVNPAFIPIALFGNEQPHERLTESMNGSYWCLMAPYVLRSGVFARQPQRDQAIVQWLQTRGGLCIGLVRFDQHSGLFANTDGVDDLYTLGYVDWLLRHDLPDQVLVSFYGKLAQGLTRNTFIGAEGTGLVPLDEYGRPMYLPPNSTSQSFFLWMLRQLLVQDQDSNDDGRPDTLRLLFATPRHWMRDGQLLEFEQLPTAFGKVSLRIQSLLSSGLVVCNIRLPEHCPKRIGLRIRLPPGYRADTAEIQGKSLSIVDETIDLSTFDGDLEIRVRVSGSARPVPSRDQRQEKQ